MIKNIFRSIIISILLLFIAVGCCNEDCPCSNEQISEFVCAPREGTITQFNANLEPDPEIILEPAIEIFYEPVPGYSIHSFEFPFNASSSGNLPNDERFSANRGISFIPVVQLPISDFDIEGDFYYAIVSDKPANHQITGDMIVDSIYIQAGQIPYALVRFKGRFAGVSERINPNPDAPPQFLSESSRDMCEYMQENINAGNINVIELRDRMSLYGELALRGDGSDLATVGDYRLDESENPVVLNTLGQMVIDADTDYNRNIVLPDTKLEATLDEIKVQLDINVGDAREKLNEYLEEEAIRYVNIELQIGDVFFYRAVNGREFLVTVINIDERDQGVALKKRLSLMFNEI
jgi:hypothetical protein